MNDFPKKIKPSLESLLASSQLVTGRQVIEGQKAKAKHLEEFAKAVEFEERNKRPKTAK